MQASVRGKASPEPLSVWTNRGFSPFVGGTNVYHYTDTLTMVKGSHALNMGGSFRAMQLNLLGDTALAGSFAFTPFFTSGFSAAGALDCSVWTARQAAAPSD